MSLLLHFDTSLAWRIPPSSKRSRPRHSYSSRRCHQYFSFRVRCTAFCDKTTCSYPNVRGRSAVAKQSSAPRRPSRSLIVIEARNGGPFIYEPRTRNAMLRYMYVVYCSYVESRLRSRLFVRVYPDQPAREFSCYHRCKGSV